MKKIQYFILTLLLSLLTTGSLFAQTVFYESFDKFSSNGGNDGKWASASTSQFNSSNLDNETGWKGQNRYAANKCIKLGKTDALGCMSTPLINNTGDFIVTFKAGAWNAQGEKTGLVISATDQADNLISSVQLSESELEMKVAEWTEYTIHISAPVPFRFKISAKEDSYNRFFLDEIRITKSVYSLTTADTDFYSLYLTKPVTIPEGMKAYTAVINSDQTKLLISEVKDVIPANTGVLLKGSEAAKYDFYDAATPGAIGNNDLKGVAVQTPLSELNQDGKTILTLGVANGVVGFHKPKNDYVGANKVFIYVDTPTSDPSIQSNAKSIAIEYADITGIHEATVAQPSSMATYNLAGQRVTSSAAKGIVIQNGKKYLTK